MEFCCHNLLKMLQTLVFMKNYTLGLLTKKFIQNKVSRNLAILDMTVFMNTLSQSRTTWIISLVNSILLWKALIHQEIRQIYRNFITKMIQNPNITSRNAFRITKRKTHYLLSKIQSNSVIVRIQRKLGHFMTLEVTQPMNHIK